MSTFIRGLQPALVHDATLRRSEFESKIDGLHKLVTYLTQREKHNAVLLAEARGVTGPKGRTQRERALLGHGKSPSSAGSASKGKKNVLAVTADRTNSEDRTSRSSRSSRKNRRRKSRSSSSESDTSTDDEDSEAFLAEAQETAQSISDAVASAEEFFTPKEVVGVMTGHPTPMETIQQRSRYSRQTSSRSRDGAQRPSRGLS